MSRSRCGSTFRKSILAAALLVAGATSVHGADFLVNAYGPDTSDFAIDGVCDSTDGGNLCTLRAAAEEAAASAEGDTIHLGTGTTILALGPLPDHGPAQGFLALDGEGHERSAIVGPNDAPHRLIASTGTVGILDLRIALLGSASEGAIAITGGGFGIVEGVYFQQNLSSAAAASIVVRPTSSLLVRYTSFDRGQGHLGGEVLIDGGAFHCDGCVFEDCSGTNGGAVHLTDSSGPIDVLIENSSFIDNRATNAGGAIYLDNTRAESSILLVNTTFHENDTVGSGGGIWTNGDRLRIRSSTFSANVANSTGAFLARGGGVAVTGGYVVPVENSILWNNVHCETFAAGNCTSYALDDCSGILASNGFNIVRAAVNGVCAVTGGHSTADPLLLDLDHHGGSTRTLPVPPGSPAIDAASPAGCSVDRDQRGEPRPDVGQGLCDLGAVEATGLLFDDDFELWEWKWSDVQQLPAAAGGSFSE